VREIRNTEESFIVDGREHGVVGVGAYRHEVSEFTDLSAHRVDGESGVHRTLVPCGCSGESDSRPVASHNCARESVVLRPGHPFAERGQLDRTRSRCGNSEFECQLSFDARTLGAIGGMRHEVCLDDEDEERRPACNEPSRVPRPPRLKVLDDLEQVCGGADGFPDFPPAMAKSPSKPSAGPSASHSNQEGGGMPPAHNQKANPAFLVHEGKYKSGWAYRVSKSGACYGSQLVKDRFELAYQVLRSAELEVLGYLEYWENQEALEWLWSARETYDQSTLEYWFGRASSRWFRSRLATVAITLSNWSACFRHGFYGFHKPVFLRCYPNNGSNAGFHAEPNVVTLARPWFEIADKYGSMNTAQIEAEQVFTVIHEMGHYSGAGGVSYTNHFWINAWAGLIAAPRDRQNDVCGGKCYQGSTSNFSAKPLYGGGAPHDLVVKFESGNDDAGEDMLDNIDNYVSYMWNRWIDRNYGEFKI